MTQYQPVTSIHLLTLRLPLDLPLSGFESRLEKAIEQQHPGAWLLRWAIVRAEDGWGDVEAVVTQGSPNSTPK